MDQAKPAHDAVAGQPLARVRKPLPTWVDPQAVVAGFRDTDGVCALLSGEVVGQTSFLMAEPYRVEVRDRVDPDRLFGDLARPDWSQGVIAVASYDAGARPATGDRGQALPLAGDPPQGWPDLILVHYRAWLEFDAAHQTICAVGLGAGLVDAEQAAQRASAWLNATASLERAPLADVLRAEGADAAYEAGVAEIVRMIARGDLFQANLARGWSGKLVAGAHPFDALLRLGHRAAAYGAGLQIGDRALVSNSPELFVTFDRETRRVETRPIKGTRARSADPVADAASVQDLADSEKDRAENLMIVDLMRNDLSRVARPGSVRVASLFEIQTLPTVHHLVSTIEAEAGEGTGPAEILQATFPPGSITGAPKHQAMKVIAGLEPPRGVWCGSLAFIDEQGNLTASVLIRTAAFGRCAGRWTVRTLAGAGIVADSDPLSERLECDAKIRAMAEALTRQEQP